MKRAKKLLFLLLLFVSCKSKEELSTELINNDTQQITLFKDILKLTQGNLPGNIGNDSIAFLLLPIQAICPACRKKIIDSIIANQHNLDSQHFIVISANGGKKTMEAFFREQGHRWPEMRTGLFLDSTNQALKSKLYTTKPVFFYGSKQKIFKKVSSMPATVKEDLRLFFSNKAS